MNLLSIFANNILPIFVVAGLGFFAARYLKVDVKSVSRLTFNILSPCLIFNILVTSQISPGELSRMAIFSLSVMGLAGLMAWLTSALLRLDRPTTSGFISVAMFANAGNYGLPLVLFAFGQEAMSLATIYFVIQLILLYSVGILVVSSSQGNLRHMLASMARVPHLYSIAAALLFVLTRTAVPALVLRPIGLLSNATIPMMMLLLGMQLERAALPERPWLVGLATAMRLLAMPALALGLAPLVGLTGINRQAAVIEASMPAAVMVTILAVEYQAAPAFVTGVVFLSTVLSPLTLTPLIAFLQR